VERADGEAIADMFDPGVMGPEALPGYARLQIADLLR